MRTLRSMVLAGLGLVLLTAAAPLPPAPEHWVTDGAGLLSPETQKRLDAKLADAERASGHQVLVWIGRGLEGATLEDWSARTFAKWRVGRAGLDDGVVLFILADAHQMRIEVGYGLEDRIPDAAASRILREVLAPGLRAGQADAAVTGAVDALLGLIGAPGGDPSQAGSSEDALPALPSPWVLIAFGVLALSLLGLALTHPSTALAILYGLSFGRGRRRDGSSSGGFSGGGGRSGGGGASGRW